MPRNKAGTGPGAAGRTGLGALRMSRSTFFGFVILILATQTPYPAAFVYSQTKSGPMPGGTEYAPRARCQRGCVPFSRNPGSGCANIGTLSFTMCRQGAKIRRRRGRSLQEGRGVLNHPLHIRADPRLGQAVV